MSKKEKTCFICGEPADPEDKESRCAVCRKIFTQPLSYGLKYGKNKKGKSNE